MNKTAKILVTGACGQIGTEMVAALRKVHGDANVIATDIHDRSQAVQPHYYTLDVLNEAALEWLVTHLGITEIYHLAAMLSASGEQRPLAGWDLNMRGLLNVLECARKCSLEKVFWPSSIAVFGPGSMPAVCFQHSKADPLTVYGISKLSGEYWCRYYHSHYGLDVRSLRYPGLISHSAPAGGGTTDYAVDIFHKALAEGTYTCFLKEGTALPMMYMDDAVRATLELMGAPGENLGVHTSYNIAAMSFTPGELAAELGKHLALKVSYAPDERQLIADSWPQSINDRQARQDWGWAHRYELDAMTLDMLRHLQVQKEQLTHA